jgi:protein involved in polysaccharide export with SLBB domain
VIIMQERSFVRNRRAKLFAAMCLCCFSFLRFGFAQQLQTPSLPTALPSALPSAPLPSGTAAATSVDDDRTDSAKSNSSSVTSSQSSNGTLTASQITSIVQARPELIVDIKQVMADYLEQQGNAVQADSITDDMLYKGIASDAGLRAAITIWLRARGYVSDSEVDGSALDPKSSDDLTSNVNATMPGLNSLTNGADMDTTLIDPSRAQSSPSGSDRTQERSSVSKRPGSKDLSSETKPDRNNPSSVEVVHQTAPYNLQSLRDLYTQVPEQTSKLKRFGSDMFLDRGLATKQMSVDIPIGPDYILGVGDGLIINLWGGVSQSFSRTVDHEGKIVLPEAGTIVVAGLSLERTQTLIQSALSQQFRDAKIAVTIARLRTVRVYVVGDVQRPGAYDISSLSTPLNALYAAGGPTSVGSLRIAHHYRGKELIREVDLYDFLLRGVRPDTERIEDGDTILVSPVGRQIAVAGMVKRPAIYELKDETKLSDVLNDAGGLLVSAALKHIMIDRVEAQGHRVTLNLNLPEGSTAESSRKLLDAFAIQDGDRVSVAPILPYSEKTIYVEGHVVRPGKFPYREDMKLNDVLRSYQDLLPEPAEHGQIIRLMPPDLHAEAIDFDVSEVLAGNEPVHLQPFDTIRILGRYEADAPKVTIRGEVLRPGSYALSEGMTVAQLVRMAGGFKRSALLDEADLVSYDLKDGKHVVSKRTSIDIGRAVKNSGASVDATLKPGDVLTVHQVTGWSDIGASIVLNGEVTYPGSYGLKEGERLSSVLLRAGGFRTTAYPAGAVLVRASVKELEEKSRAELIRQLESASAGARLQPSITGVGDAATLQILSQQQNEMIQKLRNQTSIGRLIIKIGPDIASWAGTAADVELRGGDVLTIPKRPGFILVSGQVYNATAITYVPGKNAGWYLKRAGGSTELSNRKEILIIRANGSVVGRRSGDWYDPGVLSTRLDPGDVVVVPEKIFGGGVFWRNLISVAQIASSIGFTAALAIR